MTISCIAREASTGAGKLFAGGFGHTTTVNMFLTLLDLNQDPLPLTASNYYGMADRVWRVNLNCLMGSNAAFILYKCESSPTYHVKTFINERPTILPRCENCECDLDDITSA